ncbi:DNA-binding YbaB/EbfC family protein [Breznakia sp. PF5-3]|uniref:YbaB/EbfC family nucleoid-associated protein n=1 Tax=unclassified Breznakia TaxID=2623764 RepID=UPI0024071B3F|nr:MULTISPECIES: YbaB/EbfC family nucleoid-associated protein [unclassified Breznakia]MDF9824322.1 DNA-binding YbaB/EbfC family protein [Breznakia sp. PM6-1]MDF9835087.1 DNA-binding YbaB/EbfC family protein [Breznakia sp. PF5-3]MDF9838459.1 DNA-binding YbaB/EbfC family protein [Breznakia sp. PFB2-8]MDF9860517.1 DNA-binding YbaB/EbfC family protein [Breznakia sp. PH5-24]
MDLNALMKQAQKMQDDLQETEKELKEKKYTESVGGGVVEVTLNGHFQLENVSISDELLEKDNKGVVEDLVQLAINKVLEQATKDKDERMAALTSGINMPGMF